MGVTSNPGLKPSPPWYALFASFRDVLQVKIEMVNLNVGKLMQFPFNI
jgi:hypothetical protein